MSPAMALPGLIAVAVALLLAPFDGGFATRTWTPAAVFLLTLLVVVLSLAPPARAERSRLVGGALAAYAALCALSYASMLWADVPADAWVGANRTLLYGVVLALVGLRPWSARTASWALGAVAFATAALAMGTLVSAALREDPATMFVAGRLASPAGYVNAAADLWLIAIWPAVLLAGRRGTRWWARGLALAAALLLLETSLLSQSRGALIALPVAALVYLALVPARWSALLTLAALAALAATALDSLLSVRDAAGVADLGARFADARVAIALSCLAAFALGAGATLAGPRLSGAVRARPGAVRSANAALALLVAGGAVAILVAIGSPGRWAGDRWDDFRASGYDRVATSGNRLTGSLGSNRYDFYRVALNEFRAHPVLGIGADNFAVPYLVHRRSPEAPRYPHSLAFRLLAQLGLAGTVTFATFLILMLVAVARARAAAAAPEAALIAAALAGFTMWFVHGLADWLWEFPALAALALGLLALAARVGAAPPAVRPTPPGPVGRLALAATGLVLAVALALPGLAARAAADAAAHRRDDPGRALGRLARAAALDPLDADPLIARGILASELGDLRLARHDLRRAVDREPRNWYAQLELGLAEATAGRPGAGTGPLARARALNPRQPVVAEAQARAARGDPIDAAAIRRRVAGQFAAARAPAGPSR